MADPGCFCCFAANYQPAISCFPQKSWAAGGKMNERTAKPGCSIAVSLKTNKAPGGGASGGNDLARYLMRCSWTPHGIIMVSCLSILKCSSSNLRQRRHCWCRRDNLRPAAKQGLRAWLKMKSAFTRGNRRPRESGGPGATAAALQPLDSRFPRERRVSAVTH